MKVNIMESNIKYYLDKIMDLAHEHKKVEQVTKDIKDLKTTKEYKQYLYNTLMPSL